jgi:prepilin-type N-terminal cleavage/methylation domain-containing protein
MQLTKKGFSLVETMAAIVISSVVVISLIQVTSITTKKSQKTIKFFDESIFMGLMLNTNTENINKSESRLDTEELLINHYNIDNQEIIDNLKEYSYNVKIIQEEEINPLMNGFSKPLILKKIIIQNENNRNNKYFYRIVKSEI